VLQWPGRQTMERDIEALLQQFRDELGITLGSNPEHGVLYGSRSWGDEEPDSELDILAVLRDLN
jgi:hypothetical protein